MQISFDSLYHKMTEVQASLRTAITAQREAEKIAINTYKDWADIQRAIKNERLAVEGLRDQLSDIFDQMIPLGKTRQYRKHEIITLPDGAVWIKSGNTIWGTYWNIPGFPDNQLTIQKAKTHIDMAIREQEYESRCESMAAQDFEERAYGIDRDY